MDKFISLAINDISTCDHCKERDGLEIKKESDWLPFIENCEHEKEGKGRLCRCVAVKVSEGAI